MTQRAVALVYRPGEAPIAEPRAARARAGSSSGGSRRGGTRRLRWYVAAVLGSLLAVWLVLVFGRALTDLNEASERTTAAQAEVAALQARLEAARDEIQVVQGDDFMALQARQYGLGRPGERPFALAAGAPPPPPVSALGDSAADERAASPLDAWLRLLLGRD